MKRYFVAILLLALPGSLCSQETKIARKHVPLTVIKAFENSYPHAKIEGTNKDMKDGVSYYEIESKDGKILRDILYTTDGKAVEIEETITVSDVPTPIKEAVSRKNPKEKIISAERVTKDSKIEYHLGIEYRPGTSTKRMRYEVSYGSDGTFIKFLE